MKKYSGAFRLLSYLENDIDILTGYKEIYIKEVIYNESATIVFWNDGTKTVSKCSEDDVYSKECGLLVCVAKKVFGNKQTRDLLNYWIPDQDNFIQTKVTLHDVIEKEKAND